tara:strand:+ start:283 stop:384 length:102 start_codon:yes stop_codon:yes gene_type:complete
VEKLEKREENKGNEAREGGHLLRKRNLSFFFPL